MVLAIVTRTQTFIWTDGSFLEHLCHTGFDLRGRRFSFLLPTRVKRVRNVLSNVVGFPQAISKKSPESEHGPDNRARIACNNTVL